VPPRNPNIQKGGGLTALQQAGKKIYDDPIVGCNSCHSGPGLTDGAQHDVGTATPVEVQVQKIFAGADKPQKVLYNTPSLRGLFYTAPYLHDGSAATLKAALKKTATTMGKTSHLTDKQLDALVAYLKTM
jgi:cytochrome c peroxidase